MGVGLRKRNEGQPPEVLAYCWAAQLRLCARFRRLAARERTKAHSRVGRELSRFVWGLMTELSI